MPDDYEVGSGKPPKDTRFRKGQSGNLLGRPKGSTNVQTEMKRLLVRKTKIKVNGAIQTIPATRALCLALIQKGMAGDYAPSRRSSISPAPRWPTNSKQRPLASDPLTLKSCVAPWPAKTRLIPARTRSRRWCDSVRAARARSC